MNSSAHQDGRAHADGPGHADGETGHGHSHGLVDASIVRSREGVKAVSASLAVLLLVSVAQAVVFTKSQSVALLADVIHNAGDALTAIPLGLAFVLRSKRGERWSGYFVVLVILASAVVAFVQVVEKLLRPTTPTHLVALGVAGAIGIAGNEIAAVIRWRAGRRLDSPALIADGNHARADGIVSLGVVAGAVFVGLGFPIADPLIGLAITALILRSTWQSLQTIRQS